MNISAKALMTAMLAAALPLAAAVSHAQGNLTISCARPRLPSQQAVGKLLDLANFGQVYSARDRLMRDIHKACHQGAQQVVVSNDTAADSHLRWTHAESRLAKTKYSASGNHAH
ncbi:MAG: hypothetical protein ABI767_13705 [Rhodanobacter sp.]